METEKTLVARAQMQVARLLARRLASPAILVGTLAFAGLGGAAVTATSDHDGQWSPTSMVGPLNHALPSYYYSQNCRPDPDGDGLLVCYIDPSQLSSFSNADCHTDYDGNGQLVCYIDPR